ncbi:hypothetical protein [Nocardioides litoris]|uniref:hypothetical protein n=1 Tax=Nocardioides litoris TaxID=1926648 RepID=UPI00112029F8|nr:hypothetical protein [Nocardioides litoris]
MSFEGFVDGFAPLPESPLAGMLAVPDTDLPTVAHAGPVRVVVTGGAGQVAGPVAWCAEHGLALGRLDVTVRDLDDPAGATQRLLTVTTDLPGETELHVRLAGPVTPAWLRALDLLAEVEAVVALPLDGTAVEERVDAALDRELPVSLVGGSTDAAVDGLTTTARLWGDADDLAAGRRWCRAWLADDAAAAVTQLETRS